MRRMFTLLLMLIGISKSSCAFSDYDAREIVNQFYNNIRIIAEGNYPGGQQTEDFIVARNNALGLCYSNAINLPNEFAEFNFETNDPFLEASTYIKRLFDFSVQRNPIIKADIVKVQALEEIKSTKSENSKNFYEVYVKKTIAVGYTKKEYTDIVRVIAESGKITEISNESGGGTGESIISLRGKAAELFASKNYDEAFDIYLKIIEKDSKQGDAYYRLGLMAYHKLGCKHRYSSGKERRRAAHDFIEKATRFGDNKIRIYAENVLYYMINGNV
jgi:tetratricopeptide (TPR) repeat protein